jgi:tetratricopeptide (TPR) repeat protein
MRRAEREVRSAPCWVCALILAFVLAVCVWVSGCADPTSNARELEHAGDWQGALAAYQGVLAEKPDDLTALSGAAVALMMLKRYDEAIGLQERVVAGDSRDVQTRVELGFNYLSHQNRALDAVRVLSDAVKLEPSSKNMTFLAQAQRAAGDIEGSEHSLRKAIEVDPGYGYAYTQLAALLTEAGQHDEATQVIEDARSRGLDVGEAR